MQSLRNIFLLLILILLSSSDVHATIITFSTSNNRFTPNSDNQGWWSPSLANANIANDNYLVGDTSPTTPALHNNYFTFDLAPLNLAGLQIVSAVLNVPRQSSEGILPHIYNLFDVSTDATTLNTAIGPSQTIFDDLGSGTSFGSFSMGPSDTSAVASLQLNGSAIANISSHAGGWFSIGGTLVLTGKPGRQFLFGGASSVPVSLTLDVRPVTVNAVPEPSTFAIFCIAILGFAPSHRKPRKSSTHLQLFEMHANQHVLPR